MSNIIEPKPQAKRVDLKLKSKILAEILLPNSSISKIAKRHNLSSTILYVLRMDHFKKMSQDLENNQLLSKSPENKFIELACEEDLLSNKILSSTATDKNKNSKLSAISLIFNNDISLSIKGNIKTSSLMKIINCLEEESC